MHFQEEDVQKLLFTKGPLSNLLPSTGAKIGATLGTAMNNFYSSPTKAYLHTT